MILSLDLSIHSTGYSIFDENKIFIDGGIIKPITYKGQSLDRYPIKSVNQIKSTANQIHALISVYLTDLSVILIEEVNTGGRKNPISIKGLCGLHYVLMGLLNLDTLKKVKFIKSSEWRKALNIKKNGDWKQSAVTFINVKYGTDYTREDNDLTDAICMYEAYIKALQ